MFSLLGLPLFSGLCASPLCAPGERPQRSMGWLSGCVWGGGSRPSAHLGTCFVGVRGSRGRVEEVEYIRSTFAELRSTVGRLWTRGWGNEGGVDGRLVARWLTTAACPSFSFPLCTVQFSVLLTDSHIGFFFFFFSSLYPVHLLWNKEFPEREKMVLRYLCPIEWFSEGYWTKTLSIQLTNRTQYYSTMKHQMLAVTAFNALQACHFMLYSIALHTVLSW